MSVRRILIASDAVGGVWTYTIELARALRQQGMEAVIASMGPRPNDEQLATAGTVPVIDTGLPLDWLEGPQDVRRAGQKLAHLAKDAGVDVVQLHSGAFACDVQFDRPVVVVQHSSVASWWDAVRSAPLPPDLAWRRDMIECGLNSAGVTVAPSAAYAAQIARIYSLSRPVYAVHNGRSPPALPQRPRGDFVLTVGRLWDDGKNVRTLDSAAALIDAPFEALGTLDRVNGTSVRFENLNTPGPVSEAAIAERLAGRPIFASAAHYEPFGLSVLEAAQAGCALVLSDIPTFRELWNDAAVFVPATDAQRLADSISTLLNNPELRTAYGRAAHLRATRYTPAETARRMMQIYETVTATKAANDRLAITGAA